MTWQNVTRKHMTWQGRRITGRHLAHRIRGVTRFKNRYTSPQNIEVDSDSESHITPEEEQEEPEQEEVTTADDLSMLDQLRKGGLRHVDATEPCEPIIDYSDDDDDYAFIDDTDRDYYCT